MSLLDSASSEDARMESVLAKLGTEEAPAEEAPQQEAPAASATEAPVQEAATSGPEETPVTVTEEGQSDPAEPVIEPPDSWKAEAKERFKSLPRDLQAVIAEREAEQKAAFNRQVNEAAERSKAAETARKAAEDRAASVAQEQQRYVQTLASLAQQMETLDPVIAEYSRTDLVALARENPARYAELDAAYKARVNAINAVRAEQHRVQTEAMAAHFAREEKTLLDKLPDWTNPEIGRKALNDIRQGVVTSYGYQPNEVQTIADHRLVLMARDALEAPKLRAKVAELEARIAERDKTAKQAIADKKVVPAAAKVIRPNPSEQNAEKAASDRNKAILNRARKARSLHEKAELFAQIT